MFNEATLIGRLGKDPEAKHKDGDKDNAMFVVASIATTHSWKDDQGEKHEATEWHNVTFSGKLAEVAREHLKKGALVFLRGRIHTRKWEDEKGIERYSTEIKANELRMLGRPGDKGKDETEQEDVSPQS